MCKGENRYPDEIRAKELLEWLVREDTCQPHGREKHLAQKIFEMYECCECTECEIIDHGNERASLIIKLCAEADEGGVAFAGHLDTVPCSGDDGWEKPPHSAYSENGILYGRGSADMKGGLAAMLMTLDYLTENKIRLAEPVYFCFTADEEKGGMGAIALSVHPWLQNIDELIICEPTGEQIGCCEKGALWLSFDMEGRTAHASKPELGENALDKVVALYQAVGQSMEGASFHRYLHGQSVALTRLEGGISTNMIPDKAYMELDIRTIPGGLKNEELLQLAQEKMDSDGTMRILNNRPPLETPETAEMIVRLKRVLGRRRMNTECKGIYFYTDASQMVPKLKKPFVILGPGDERQAHCTNEHIEIASVSRMAEVYLDYLTTERRK